VHCQTGFLHNGVASLRSQRRGGSALATGLLRYARKDVVGLPWQPDCFTAFAMTEGVRVPLEIRGTTVPTEVEVR